MSASTGEPPPVVLRRARPDEAAPLSALALRSKASWGYEARFLADCEEELTLSRAVLQREDFHCLVAERAGRRLGFCAVQRITAECWEMEALYVEPGFMALGIGRRLLAAACALAAAGGARSVIVQSDPHAAGFYRAAGGRPIGERESESIPGRRLPVMELFVGSSPPAAGDEGAR